MLNVILETCAGTLTQGLIYAILSYGIFITYKILDFPDLTVDGSFPLGAAVTAVLLTRGVNAWLTLPVAMLIGAAACFLGVSRRGMLLCSLMGMLVAQGAAGVSGVLRADVQPWTDAALLCASISTALAEIVRRTAIFLLTPPGVKGGHRG